MADIKGTIIVTGANGGLGSAIVSQILSTPEFSNYHGLFTVRDATSSSAAGLHTAINRSSSQKYDILSLDLTKTDNVRQVADTINNRVAAGEIPPIRALILNAGVNEFDKQTWTHDGFDTAFVSNYLGHWLLTLLLLKSMDREVGRIVAVGSQSHDPYDKRNEAGGAFQNEKWKTILSGDDGNLEAISKGKWSTKEDDASWHSGFRRYGAAKLCLVMMIGELQRRLDQDPQLSNISVLEVDPGTMSTGGTGIARNATWFIRVILFGIIFPLIVKLSPNGAVRTPERSATDVLAAAFESGEALGEHPKAKHFDGRTPLDPSAESKDPKKRDLVWKASLAYTNFEEGETILENWK
ncbi:putative short-chain dehydrogenase [Nemania sp. NC0429]|nr:putative short-chain dehydrogenase [Nemania sp. NC0429]